MPRRSTPSSDDGSGIEFLAPDARAFGEGQGADLVGDNLDGPAAFAEEPRTSRRVTVLAVMLVAAIAGVGVVAASPWSDDSAAPSTTAPASETSFDGATPGTTPTSAAAMPRGWVLDDRGWTPLFAWSGASDGTLSELDVWTDGAPETSSRWLVVQRDEVGDFRLYDGCERTEAGGRRVIICTGVDGATEATVLLTGDDGRDVLRLRAAPSLALDEVLEVAASLTVRQETVSGLGYGDGGRLPVALDGMQLGWSGRRPFGSIGSMDPSHASVSYARSDQQSGVSIDLHDVERSLIPFDRLIAPNVGDDGASGAPVPDPSVATRSAWGLELAVAPADDGRVVTVTESWGADAATVASLLASVRPATTEEWASLTSDASWSAPPPELAEATLTGRLSVDDGDRPWNASMTPWWFTASILTGDVGIWSPTIDGGAERSSNLAWSPVELDGERPTVSRLTGFDLSAIVVSAPLDGEVRRARITMADREPVEIVLTRLADQSFAVGLHLFRSTDRVTVDLLDGDGAVVSTQELAPTGSTPN